MCFEFFSIILISYLFLYKLATYHWKGLEESYNFVVEALQSKLTCKSCSNKISNTFIPQENIPMAT
jgi:hypothetical protein